MRTKLKNLVNGNVNEKTWRAGESVVIANMESMDMQYSYDEAENFVFMNSESASHHHHAPTPTSTDSKNIT